MYDNYYYYNNGGIPAQMEQPQKAGFNFWKFAAGAVAVAAIGITAYHYRARILSFAKSLTDSFIQEAAYQVAAFIESNKWKQLIKQEAIKLIVDTLMEGMDRNDQLLVASTLNQLIQIDQDN